MLEGEFTRLFPVFVINLYRKFHIITERARYIVMFIENADRTHLSEVIARGRPMFKLENRSI